MKFLMFFVLLITSSVALAEVNDNVLAICDFKDGSYQTPVHLTCDDNVWIKVRAVNEATGEVSKDHLGALIFNGIADYNFSDEKLVVHHYRSTDYTVSMKISFKSGKGSIYKKYTGYLFKDYKHKLSNCVQGPLYEFLQDAYGSNM